MRNQLTAMAVLALTSLAGCDQISALVGDNEEAAPAAVPARDLVAETKSLGLVGYAGETMDGVVVPEGLPYSLLPGGGLQVSGVLNEDRRNSGGRTQGVSFEMPPGLEEQVAGHAIRVHIVTSAETVGEAFLAYSTNEVGNSGWMPFPLTIGDSVATLEYNVNEMREGRGDFVGIDPNGHTLTIKAIVIEIAD